MLRYADDRELLWASMAQMERVCVPSALLFPFIPTDSSTTPSPWWFPDLKPTIYTLSHRERDPLLFSRRIPKCFTVLFLSLYPSLPPPLALLLFGETMIYE